MPEGREPGRKGWLQVTPAVGRSRGQPTGDRSRGHNPPAGLATRFALGRGICPHLAVPSVVTLQGREGARAGEDNLSFQWQTVCLIFLCMCVCVLVCRGLVAALASPLSSCQRAAGRAQAGMLLGFLEGSMPLGGTKKLR